MRYSWTNPPPGVLEGTVEPVNEEAVEARRGLLTHTLDYDRFTTHLRAIAKEIVEMPIERDLPAHVKMIGDVAFYGITDRLIASIEPSPEVPPGHLRMVPDMADRTAFREVSFQQVFPGLDEVKNRNDDKLKLLLIAVASVTGFDAVDLEDL